MVLWYLLALDGLFVLPMYHTVYMYQCQTHTFILESGSSKNKAPDQCILAGGHMMENVLTVKTMDKYREMFIHP